MSTTIRIPPYNYIHVKDNNTNVTHVVTGPQTYVKQDQEKIIVQPTKMVALPSRHYCCVLNPVSRGADGKIVVDRFGQSKNLHGEKEYRFNSGYKEPFPLYPNEKLEIKPKPLRIIPEGEALLIRATRDLEINGEMKYAGDEWYVTGLCTYYPRVEEEEQDSLSAHTIFKNSALRLKALQEFKDRTGVLRNTGEEWLYRIEGSYLKSVQEVVVSEVKGITLTEKNAIKLQASQNFTDIYGVAKKAGEEWLVTHKTASFHIPDVYETLVCNLAPTTLAQNQYVVVCDPFDEKEKCNKLGSKVIRRGIASFFLSPGEYIEGGEVREIKVLSVQDALLVQAKEKFVHRKVNDPIRYDMIMKLYKSKKTDQLAMIENKRTGYVRVCLKSETNNMNDYEAIFKSNDWKTYLEDEIKTPGDRWMEYGPQTYMPPVEVEVLNDVKEIALAENEGIYIRDTVTGQVRAIIGETYMLKANEVLTEIDLPKQVTELLQKESSTPLDLTRLVTFKIPYNTAVQVYDYKQKTARVVFGPDLISLNPDECFTVHSLSGGKPKRPNVIQS